MILEVAILHMIEGRQGDFEKDFCEPVQFISFIEGYLGHSLQKCVEVENQYILLVEWAFIDAHEMGFRQSPQYLQWKALLHQYYDPFPQVLHYTKIDQHDKL